MSATPFSYRQYAGNGSTTTFSVPFPYLLKAHVKVYLGFNILDGTFSTELADGVGFSWTSSSQIQAATAPAVGQVLTVIRQTPSGTRLVDWQDGSNLIADDLDTADLQNLYVVQEQQDRTDAGALAAVAAQSAATSAANAATAATTAANSANATAAAAATAATNATNAAAASTAASTAATVAAGQASADAAAAIASATTANSNASTALTTANAANVTANQAAAAVSQAVLFTLVADVASIPASPANNTYIEVGNSTGIQSFSPLTGLPGGFVGDAGLTVRIRYTTTGATWNYLSYFANNPETRYLGPGNLASQAEAEAGSNNAKWVSPLRVAQAIAALATSGATGGGTDKVFVQNDQTITTSYTIPSGKNASSVGPVSIDAGATVTISANSTWVIL